MVEFYFLFGHLIGSYLLTGDYILCLFISGLVDWPLSVSMLSNGLFFIDLVNVNGGSFFTIFSSHTLCFLYIMFCSVHYVVNEAGTMDTFQYTSREHEGR